ncbi:hypothetical protein [uncultured Corynebacterium sp.]|nr:hypothetical protein [uncultured Corynebacterium sp.]
MRALNVQLSAENVAFLKEPYQAHPLVGPKARLGEPPLAGTTRIRS